MENFCGEGQNFYDVLAPKEQENDCSNYRYGDWGEGWLGFQDLWSGQKPWWNWYLTPVVNFDEVRLAQLAKSTLLTSSLVPLGSFRSFKVCSDAKQRVGFGKQREATAPIHAYCTPTTRKSQGNETEGNNSVNEWRVHMITHVGTRISIGWL